jgi:ABC-type uncharacterized transport system permease subunit
MTEPYFNFSSNGTNSTLECLFQNCTNELEESYIDDLERSISISVFILFGFIFIAGLIGNGLVVLGEHKNIAKLVLAFSERL